MADIATIFKELSDKLGFLSHHEKKVIRDIMQCRTEALGGNVVICDSCGHSDVHYNSCRNRHCPKCQNLARLQWVSAQLQQILPVPYFHAVFTIPEELKLLALYNKKAIYNLLFYSVHKTLMVVAKRKENLGMGIGGISVLHTWNQKLDFHPHIHCILPGVGRLPNGDFKITSSNRFFLSVKKLSVVFRGIFLRNLEKLYSSGDLKTTGKLSNLCNPKAFSYLLRKSCSHKWVVYLKRPFGGPEKVFQYLGKYTHRVGISNQRIVSADNRSVVFSYIDRKDNNTRKLLPLSSLVFAKRFILHILPSRFVKIRYFGFLANCVRKKLAPIVSDSVTKELGIDQEMIPQSFEVAIYTATCLRKEYRCPKCGKPMRLCHSSPDRSVQSFEDKVIGGSEMPHSSG
jgi:hypothetical protein